MNSKSAIVIRVLGGLLATIAFVWSVQAEQRVTLAWDAPTGDTNIGGYYLYYGAESGKYTNVLSLRANVTRTSITGLVDGVTYFFVVTAHRSGLESTFSNETNFTAPTILALDDQVTTEDTPLVVPFTIADAETTSLLLRVTGESSNQGLVPNANLLLDGWGTGRTLTIIPAPDQSGTTTITVRVNDGTATASTSFLLTVDSVNDSPTLDPLDDVALLAVAGLRRVSLTGITAGAADEIQPLTVTATSDSALISSPVVEYSNPSQEGSVSFSPLSVATGRATITVTVKTGGGQTPADSFSRSFSVYVRSPANAPPTISAIADQVIDEDTSTQPIAFSIGDDTTPANLLTVATRSSNTNLVPEANVVVADTGSSRTVTVHPALNHSGTSKITIEVTDRSFGFSARTFVLTVRPVKDAPISSQIPDQIVNEDSGTIGPIPFTVDDVDAPGRAGISQVFVTTLTTDGCSTNAVVPPSNVVCGGSGRDWALTFRPARDESGRSRISMIATNGQGDMSTNSFLVHVVAVNDLPTLDALPDIIIGDDKPSTLVPLLGVTSGAASECQTLVVRATSEDPSLIPDPEVNYASPNGTGSLLLTHRPDRFGTTVITVMVDDGGVSNNVVSQEFTARVVHVNRHPTISQISDQTLNEDGSTAAIPFTIGDQETPATQLILYPFTSNPDLIDAEGIFLDGSGTNRTIVMRPAKNQFGTATIALSVFDADGGNASSSFVLTVNPVNDPPSLDAISDISVFESGRPKILGLTGMGAGAIGEIQFLTVSASGDSASLTADVSVDYTSPYPNGILVITPVAGATGSARVTVTLEDDGGTVAGGEDKVTRSFLFTVLPRPKLDIGRNSGGVIVSWPSSAAGFQLEAAENLPSEEWNAVAAVPIVVGERNQVTLGAADARKYFRLQQGLPEAKLNIRPAGNRIVLSWPDSLIGYRVEVSEDFPATVWEPLTVPPVLAGDQNTVTLEITERFRFFRLRTTDSL